MRRFGYSRAGALALFLAAAPALGAQQTCVRGLVEKTPPFSICVTRATHQFRCANLRLQSSAVRLTQFEGQVVEACGTVRRVGACRDMTVATVRTMVDSHRISGVSAAGTVGLGKMITFKLGVNPARLWVLFLAGNRAFTNLGAPGVLLLGNPFVFFANGVLDGNGSANLGSQVPNDAALLNANFYFQPGFVNIQNMTAALGNSECFRVVQ